MSDDRKPVAHPSALARTIDADEAAATPAAANPADAFLPTRARAGQTGAASVGAATLGATASAISINDHAAERPAPPLVGMVIADRYEILAPIGKGGMGVVYAARHKTLGSRFAVKVLLHPQSDEDGVRFLREARLSSQVSHPNTVYIADFGVLPDGRSYLVMEFLRGQTLAAVIAQGPLPAGRACAIAAQIAHGLHAVHKKGIVHRDLKPDNVFLLDEEGRPDFVKIVDFGIAKVAVPDAVADSPSARSPTSVRPELPHHLTRPGSVLGTPYYLAPEQARGEATDFRADQYALGCMLYEMLCGSVPFDDATLIGLLRKQMDEPPKPLAAQVPELPPALDALVGRLLAKKPADRFPSMQEVAQALEAVGRPAGSRPRNTRSAALLAAVLGGSLLLGGALTGRLFFETKNELTTQPPPSPAELAAAAQQARSVLRQQLLGPDRKQRLAVLDVLPQSHDATFTAPLEALSDGPDPELATRAAATLGQLGDRSALPTLRRLLVSAPPRQRLSIARALTDLGDETGQKTLTSVLHSSDRIKVPAELRLQAAFLLCDADEPAAQQLLFELAELGTTPTETVLDVLTCLGRSPRAALARTRLRARFRAQLGPARILTATRLAQLGDREAQDFLRALTRQPGATQLVAARALAAPDEPELAQLFRRTLGGNIDETTQLLATTGIGLTGGPQDVPPLAGQLAQESAAAARRTTAAAILTLYGREPTSLNQSSLRFINQALEDPSWMVRADAVAALGHSADGGAVQLLARLLGDDSAQVRSTVARALGLRHELRALAVLRTGLRDRDADVRAEVLKALAHLGSYLKAHGLGAVTQELTAWLLDTGASLPIPPWQRAALLLMLGDEHPEALLRTHPEFAQPVGQHFLLALGFADRAWLLTCLQSTDLAIQLAAAGRLAEKKDAAGRAILDGAIKRGGAVAIRAYGMLAMLGEPVPEEPLLAGLDLTAPLTDRLAVVAMAAALPPERAVALWQKAAYDPDRAVRRAVTVAISEVAVAALQQKAVPVLRILIRDSDLGTRAQAEALLGQLLQSTEPPANPRPAASHSDLVNPVADGGTTDGYLDLESPAIRDGSVADAADSLPADGTTSQLFESALREGLLASKRQDFERAQKLLLRARSLCTATHPPPERCRTLVPEATLQLAQNYDGQQRFPDAMREYRKLLSDHSFRSADPRLLLVQTSVLRLTGVLGQVIISSQTGKSCRHETVWRLPGDQSVSVNGKPTAVVVTVGRPVQVGDCK